jgi:hypothetical protein
MFCSNCGAEVSGNFCSGCGAPLGNVSASSAAVAQDWSREILYEKLIRVPEVREIVSRHAAMAKKRISGERVSGLLRYSHSARHITGKNRDCCPTHICAAWGENWETILGDPVDPSRYRHRFSPLLDRPPRSDFATGAVVRGWLSS